VRDHQSAARGDLTRSVDGAPGAGPRRAFDEQALVDRIRAGEVEAFEALFRTYYNSLCVFAEGYVRSPDVAEELVDDIFCRIWERRADWQVTHGVRAYLYASVRNRALNSIARERVALEAGERADREDVAIAMGQAEPSPEDRVAATELEAAVKRAWAALPPRCHQTYLLHRQHGMSYAEIASIMGISIKTVENQLARALKALRMSLAAWIP